MKKINDTTFKNENKEFEVEIGDSKQPDFKPQIKLKRWDNECNFSCRLIDDEEFNLESDEQKISYKGIKKECSFYEVEKGFEFDIVLKEKPKSNKIDFSIQSKELKFFYQPELTNDELAEGNYRPENVIGSYAVYHASKKNYKRGEKNYKSGKAFHIYRPKIFDAEDNWVWGELNIDTNKGILSVTIPQEFLDNAVYPIRNAAGLVFGYETAGTAGSRTMGGTIVGSVFTGAEGTGTSISIYHNPSYSTYKTKCAVYVHSDSSLLADGTTEEKTGFTGADWRTYNFTASPTLTNVAYVLVGWADITQYVTNLLYYDTGDANQGHYQSLNYGDWPDPLEPTHEDRVYSIYCTYEVGGGQQYSETCSDTTTISDTFSKILVTSRTLNETLNLTDNLSFSLSTILEDTTNLLESFTKNTIKEFNEIVSLSDGDTYFITLLLEEELSLLDNYSKIFDAYLNLVETFNLTESIQGGLSYFREYSETLSLSDGEYIGWSKSLSENLNISDSAVGRLDTSEDSGAAILSTNQIKPIIVSAESCDYLDYRNRK